MDAHKGCPNFRGRKVDRYSFWARESLEIPIQRKEGVFNRDFS